MRFRSYRIMFIIVCVVVIGSGTSAKGVEYTVSLLPLDANVQVSSTDGVNFGGNSFGDERHAITLDSKLENLMDLNPEGYRSSGIVNVSADHQVGWANEADIFIGQRATLWNGTAETAVDLHPDRFQYSGAVDMSGDHQIGNGFLQNGLRTTALLWNGTAESVVELTPPGFWNSVARAISGDSQVGHIVPNPPNAIPRAALWHGTAESYIDLHPAGYRYSDAFGVSGDVQVGVGDPSGGVLGEQHALMWRGTAESFVDLHPEQFDFSIARDVAGDVIVGAVFRNDFPEEAFAWHGTAEGAINLHSYLEVIGADYTYSSAFSVTDDGTIYGWTNGHIAIWTPIADGDFDQSGQFDLVDILLLFEQIQSEDPDLDYDLDDDAQVTSTDLHVWIKGLRKTWIGDADLDGEFNTSDLVAVFQAGNFEKSDLLADWSQGDWNGDGAFNTSDLVAAFQDGGFERGPREAVVAVPEPNSILVFMVGLMASCIRGRRLTF